MKKQQLKITTAYSLGDPVWWMEDNKIKHGIIASIDVRIITHLKEIVDNDSYTERKEFIEYSASIDGSHKHNFTYGLPDTIYPSKEELIKAFY